jgi:hypothetical protein
MGRRRGHPTERAAVSGVGSAGLGTSATAGRSYSHWLEDTDGGARRGGMGPGSDAVTGWRMPALRRVLDRGACGIPGGRQDLADETFAGQ